MKKFLLVVILILIFSLNFKVNIVNASSKNLDETINGILNGINDSEFQDINKTIDSIFLDNLSFKDRVIKFLTGELNLSFDSVLSYLKGIVLLRVNYVVKILCYLLFLGIFSFISNIIISKNYDNTENNIVFYICYILAVLIITKLILELFNLTYNTLKDISNKTEIFFPIMFSISSLCGNFGVSIYKPLTGFVAFFSSSLTKNYILPLLMFGYVITIISGVNDNIKLSNFGKSIFSLFKWVIGFIVVIYTVFISIQGVSNSAYNGISVKILKYTTGSMIPIVGGFLSSGMDLLLSSAILVKNSVGLMAVIYMLISVVGCGVNLLITSFVFKFGSTICESILDKKYFNLLNNVCDLIKNLSVLVFLSGYMYFITVLGFIFSTISVI